MTGRPVPRVLSIAGTDPTGGAGVQADLKSIGALGGYAMAAVTALVAQNTRGVRSVHVPDPAFLAEQLDAVSDDVTIDAVKLGMLHSTPLIRVVARWLEQVRPPVVVLDPVMVATSGDRLLDRETEQAVRTLCERVDLVTPNLPELGVLVDRPAATSWAEALDQARHLAKVAGTTVLLKGGHLDGADCPDAIVTSDDVVQVDGRRVRTTTTHGTGCSLSSAMATLHAQGLSWPAALERAKEWLAGALEHGAALEVGRGNGPVDHFHELRPTLPTSRWTAAAWTRTAEVRDAVDACGFVEGLRDGTLDRSAFTWYLAQDAIYLGEYARLLAIAGALAPTTEEQVFWAERSVSALAEEASLHRSHVGTDLPPAAEATTAYVDHLRAAALGGSYAVVVAAVLPCFWLYADVGTRLAAADRDGHPYGEWLRAYGDPEFARVTDAAIRHADRAARHASSADRRAMDAAFDRAMELELAFFEAPLHRDGR